MRLTNHTDYSLRTLMYLATTRRRITIDDVANLFGISANHVAKVVNHLARCGYVRSIRGIGGGIELAMSPEEISVGAVITSCGGTQLLECVSIENVCVIQSFCKLKGVLAEAERIQMDYLNSIKLTDIVPQKRQLDSIDSTRTKTSPVSVHRSQ
jgi:Rrf2 family nitric oxide-sensitive transcriptional repressor